MEMHRWKHSKAETRVTASLAALKSELEAAVDSARNLAQDFEFAEERLTEPITRDRERYVCCMMYR